MFRTRFLALIVAILLAAGCCAGLAEQEPADRDALAGLKSAVTEANRSDYDFTDRALEYLAYIGENYPDRSEDDGAREAFRDWLTAELAACGYDPARIGAQSFSGEDMFGDPAQGKNIVLTVPGKRDGRIIVGAHYDGDGVGDNGSGVALLLATAAGLVDVEPECTVQYVFFDREEEGKVGSRYFAGQMSAEAIASTLYMVNLDALAFGDFCNIYGGVYGDDYAADYIAVDEGEENPQPEPEHLEGYAFATELAERLGFRVYRPEDLDGYFEANGRGMEPEEGAFFTNPWTYAHPAPQNMEFMGPSPTTIGASDHAPFAVLGIPYIYFEATNWWAESVDEYISYMGYVETYDASLGEGGQFMNTEYDTLENLRALFPGRAEQHYRQFSPLLSALLLVEK